MPAIISQRVDLIDTDHATVTLQTVECGEIFVDVLQTIGPPQVTITTFRNGVQVAQAVLNNPPAATVEAEIVAAVEASITDDRGVPLFRFYTRLISVSPLRVAVMAANHNAFIREFWWM